jgi:hypothetical protein
LFISGVIAFETVQNNVLFLVKCIGIERLVALNFPKKFPIIDGTLMQ